MGGSRTGPTEIAPDMLAMWEGGETQRFHTVMTLRPDTVGQHSYGVACVLMHLHPYAPARLLRAALKHDMAEAYTGDLPAPSKRALGIRDQFAAYESEYLATVGIGSEVMEEPWEGWLLKFCDSMDGLRVTIRERAMGNQMIEVAHQNFAGYIIELLVNQPEGIPNEIYRKAAQLARAMNKEWEYVSK